MIIIPEDQNALVSQFVEQYYALKSALTEDKLKEATEGYTQLLSKYNEINASQLATIHKEMAYQHLIDAHQELTQQHQNTTSSTNYVAIALVLIIVSTIIFLQPALVGLFVYEGKQTMNFHQSFIESGEKTVTLTTPPRTLSVSGSITGKGQAKLYLIAGNEKRLVFDKEVVPLTNNTFFKETCIETCTLPNSNTHEITLAAELTGTILSIDTIEYETSTNQPPVYTATSKSLAVSDATTINLRDYFSDPNNDVLAFVVLPSEDITTQLVGSLLTITPKSSGTHELTIIASDPKESIRVTLEINNP